MPYPYNGSVSTYNASTNGSAITLSEFVATPETSGIRLFNDAAGNGVIIAGALPGKTGIECTSCHDIHNGATVKDQLLLRGMMGGTAAAGYICTKCHAK
jgi:hypothetical protein